MEVHRQFMAEALASGPMPLGLTAFLLPDCYDAENDFGRCVLGNEVFRIQ
jgi:hypothetical protein